ncbi:MAG: hypothetical protein QNJ89_05125 [Acidimicrobiia bacterium]|nr:hypothetical protein [Acidimicrobiia bacterium]
MSAQHNTYLNFNHLRRGLIYRAKTAAGFAVGEYLGMEALYGDRAVLLRNATGTESIYHQDILAIEPVAA